MNESIADNYFKLGLASVYVTDKKTEGFSDIGLQNVAMFVRSESDSMAHPAKIAQSYGRLRGLVAAKIPNFFFVTPAGSRFAYGVRELNLSDSSSQYLSAIKHRKKNVLKILGDELADEIISYISNNANSLGEINDGQLGKVVTDLMLDKLKVINQENTYNFNLSTKDLNTTVAYAIQGIKEHARKVNDGVKLTLFARVVALLGYLWASMVKRSLVKPALKNLEAYNKENGSFETKLHQKIVRDLDITEVAAHSKAYAATVKTAYDLANNIQKLDFLGDPEALDKVKSDVKLTSKLLTNESFVSSIKFIIDNFEDKELHLLTDSSSKPKEKIEQLLELIEEIQKSDLEKQYLEMLNKFTEAQDTLGLLNKAFDQIKMSHEFFYNLSEGKFPRYRFNISEVDECCKTYQNNPENKRKLITFFERIGYRFEEKDIEKVVHEFKDQLKKADIPAEGEERVYSITGFDKKKAQFIFTKVEVPKILKGHAHLLDSSYRVADDTEPTWRACLALRGIQKSLGAINEIDRIVKKPKAEKSVEVADKILKPFRYGFKNEAQEIFTQSARKLSETIKKEKKVSSSIGNLGEHHEDRIEKMRSQIHGDERYP